MEEADYRQLVRRYLEKRLDDDELEVFAHLLLEGKLDGYLAEAMDKDSFEADDLFVDDSLQHPINRINWLRRALALAATIVLVIGVAVYFHQAALKPVLTKASAPKHDFMPGTSKAILTLADGSNLTLSGAENGLLAHQGKTAIQKNDDGKIAYHQAAASDTALAAVMYNTVATPKGGEYQIDLPDGTRVWLNSASSVRFPAAFTGRNRMVEISGEVYFEVAKNKEKPFIVTAGNQQVTVLGTHFNINAYQDDGLIKTTLLEGSVKVSSGSNALTIRPGEQARLNAANELDIRRDVDTDEIMAWKNGCFQFNNADVQTIMNQLSRWYNVEVSYAGAAQPGHYNGKISRKVNASKVLKVLELSGMHFTIEGGKIIVR